MKINIKNTKEQFWNNKIVDFSTEYRCIAQDDQIGLSSRWKSAMGMQIAANFSTGYC